MQVVGVDSCREGWVSVTWNLDDNTLAPRVHRSFAQLLAFHQDAAAIGVDIPIGLNEGTPRRCDIAARKVLGPRKTSVFPAPDPRLLFELGWREADSWSRALNGKGLSQQTFGILRKTAEVNWAMQGENQDRVFEVHPEVSFWALSGRLAMTYRKTWPEGYAERRALLETEFGIPLWEREDVRKIVPAAPDDLLDATVAAWTARRVAEGRAERLPQDPPIDRRGLRMEMVF